MKKLLSVFGALGLVATSSSLVVACDTGEAFQGIDTWMSYDQESDQVRLNFKFYRYLDLSDDLDLKGLDTDPKRFFTTSVAAIAEDEKGATSVKNINGLTSQLTDVSFDSKKLDDMEKNSGDGKTTNIKFNFGGFIVVNGLANQNIKELSLAIQTKAKTNKGEIKIGVPILFDPSLVKGSNK